MRTRGTGFQTETPPTYPTKEVQELTKAILSLKTSDEATKFLRDLLTMAEIAEFANRWQMVKLLSQGHSYATVAQKLNVSTTTVTRVAHWFYNGLGGYKLVADRLFPRKFKDARPEKGFRLRGKRTNLSNPFGM